jgi:putative ABC transport system permease protein
MARIPGIRSLFRLPASERGVAGDVEDEIAFHVEERTRELTARGMAPEAARAEALREFGDVGEARAELERIGRRRVRRTRRSSWWSDLRQDLGYGVRSAVHAPLFSLLAVLTLALGIGANAAVFGVVKSVLLDSLPYADADRLVRVYGHLVTGSDERGPLSAGTVTDVQERQQSFASLSAFNGQPTDAVFGGEDGPRVARVGWVQPGFFEMLGVSPAMGRTLQADDPADTARVAVLTHAAWQRYLGGDPGALGREVRINGIARTVVGVLPREYVSPIGAAGEPDLYFALDLRPTLRNPVSVRRSHWLGMVGRLNPGVTHEAARRELAAIGAELAREHPEDNTGIDVVAMPLREALVGDTRTPLLVLMASAALVLLIACANLAGALLSRALSRRREFAVRVALGAGRGRLVRQLLTESTLLALAGGAAGLLLAWLGLATLRGLALPALPAYADLTLDGGAVLVTALLAILTGLAFGVAPALSVGRADPQGTLRDETRGASESRRSRRLRGVLVAGQIALCVSLLAGAGLLARSLWAMTSTPLGFDPERMLAVSFQVPGRDYPTPESAERLYEQYRERLAALPGVTAVASASMPPTQVLSRMGFTIDGAPPLPADQQLFVLYANVSDEYFRTLRIPLRQGRVFDARDHGEAPPTVVISEAMARRYWPAGDALGSRIRMGPDREAPLLEVVGIVGDVRNDPTQAEAEPMAYRSMRQDTWPLATFLVRAEGDPLALVRPAERELAALDPGLPLREATTLRAMLGQGLAERRLPVVLMAAFGALALLLASIGVYALFASMAAAREREFGVRMALGSSRRAIATLVLWQGGVWMALGLAGGALGIVLVSRLLRDLLYGVAPFDPLTLGLAVLVLLGCATAALLTPVRRATRVDPATAMRAQ